MKLYKIKPIRKLVHFSWGLSIEIAPPVDYCVKQKHPYAVVKQKIVHHRNSTFGYVSDAGYEHTAERVVKIT